MFELAAIRFHARQVGTEIQHHRDILSDEAPEHGPHVDYDGVQIQERRLDDLLPAECQQLARQPRTADAGLLNLRHVRLAGVVDGEIIQQQIAVPENDGQQIVEVVGHAAGESSDGLHLLRLLIPLLQRAAFGHIQRNAHAARRVHHAR